MSNIIKLKDIDEAINNLQYKNESTLKYKLIGVLRSFYEDDNSVESLKSIDAEELIKQIWNTGDDADLIKTRRKNFSSAKSGVNSDLKKLYQDGKNSQGIIIGHNNVFDISTEAKDKALSSIADIFREKGIDSIGTISEILAALNDTLTNFTSVGGTRDEIDRAKNLIGDISKKMGISLPELAGSAQDGKSEKGSPPSSGMENQSNTESTGKQQSFNIAKGNPAQIAKEGFAGNADIITRLADAAEALEKRGAGEAESGGSVLSDREREEQTRFLDELVNRYLQARGKFSDGQFDLARLGAKTASGERDKEYPGGYLSGGDKLKQSAESSEETAKDLAGSQSDLPASFDKDGQKALSGTAGLLNKNQNIAEILAALNASLSDAISPSDAGYGHSEIDRIKQLVGDICGKVGLAVRETKDLGQAAGESEGQGPEESPGEGKCPGEAGTETAAELETVDEVVSADDEIVEIVEEPAVDSAAEVIEEISEDELADIGDEGTEGGLAETQEDGTAGVSTDLDAEIEIIEEELPADELVEVVEEAAGDAAISSLEQDGQSQGLGLEEAPGTGQGEGKGPGQEETPGEGEGEGLGPKEVPGKGEGGIGGSIEPAAGAAGTEIPDQAEYEEIEAVESTQQASDTAVEEITEEEIVAAGDIPIEEIPEEELADDGTIGEAVDEVSEDTATSPESEELVEVVEAIDEAAGAMPEDYSIAEEVPADDLEEIVEELVDADTLAAGEGGTPGESGTGKAAGESIDEDLRDKAEFLSELAEAAKALDKLGPDLSSSIYSEEEIREKAKLLSEEFNRYLSVREKFYNQHILIKSGQYLVGGKGSGQSELREQLVPLRDFYIGKFPVTNALFEIFVEKTGYLTTAERFGFGMVYVPRVQEVKDLITGAKRFIWNSQLQCKKIPGACWYSPAGPGSTLYIKRTHPVVQVSLEDACAFAAWTGKRIPTEVEWEATARTSRGFLYPWGNNWKENSCNLENSHAGDTTPVDKYIKCENEYGVADTLGNVLEWTLDSWDNQETNIEDLEVYVVKGASWASDYPVSLLDRQPLDKTTSSNILGFRCIAI